MLRLNPREHGLLPEATLASKSGARGRETAEVCKVHSVLHDPQLGHT